MVRGFQLLHSNRKRRGKGEDLHNPIFLRIFQLQSLHLSHQVFISTFSVCVERRQLEKSKHRNSSSNQSRTQRCCFLLPHSFRHLRQRPLFMNRKSLITPCIEISTIGASPDSISYSPTFFVVLGYLYDCPCDISTQNPRECWDPKIVRNAFPINRIQPDCFVADENFVWVGRDGEGLGGVEFERKRPTLAA